MIEAWPKNQTVRVASSSIFPAFQVSVKSIANIRSYELIMKKNKISMNRNRHEIISSYLGSVKG